MSTYFILAFINSVAISSGYPFKKNIFTSKLMYVAFIVIFLSFSCLYIDFLTYNKSFILEKIIVGYYGWGQYDNLFKIKILMFLLLSSTILIIVTTVL